MKRRPPPALLHPSLLALLRRCRSGSTAPPTRLRRLTQQHTVLVPDSSLRSVPKAVTQYDVWKESKNFPGTIHDYCVLFRLNLKRIRPPAQLRVCVQDSCNTAPLVFSTLIIVEKQMPDFEPHRHLYTPGTSRPSRRSLKKNADGKPNTPRFQRAASHNDSLGDLIPSFFSSPKFFRKSPRNIN